ETQVRRHHEDDQTQTQGGKEDDAEALASVEGYVGWAGHSGAINQSKSVASGRAPSGRSGTEIVARGPAQSLACRNVQPQVVGASLPAEGLRSSCRRPGEPTRWTRISP